MSNSARWRRFMYWLGNTKRKTIRIEVLKELTREWKNEFPKDKADATRNATEPV